MNNDRPPASKLRKWLMGNNESTLPGLTCRHLNSHALGVRHTHLTQISLMAKLLTHHNLEISRIKKIKTP